MRAPLTCLLISVVVATPAAGTIVKPLSDDDMIRGATRIFQGTVTSARAETLPNGRIATRFRFAVSEDLFGAPNATTELLQIGGRKGNRVLVIPGAATFKLGEEAVVFVGRACPKTGCAFTLGLAQGKFSVRTDKRTKRRIAVRRLGHLKLTRASRAGHVRDLTALLRQIRRGVRARQRRGR